ncbi:MAG TPA: hypothetical protein VF624_12035 [Tepidisphaeraceae bacterium]
MVTVRPSVIEVLESRSLLSSELVYAADFSSAEVVKPGVSASFQGYDPQSSEYPSIIESDVSLTLSNLPTHSMVRVFTGINLADPLYSSDWEATLKIGESEYVIEGSGSNYELYNTAQASRWFTHSGDSLTISWSSNGFDLNQDAYWAAGADMISVEVYNPTITASGGGGSMTEAGNANGAGLGSGSATFTVNRDLPIGWLGVPAWDEPIPDSTISVSRGGTATLGSDYTHASGSAELPTGTVTLAGSSDHKTFTIIPKDDDTTESRGTQPNAKETVTWNVAATAGTVNLLAEISDDSSNWHAAITSKSIPEPTEVYVGVNSGPSSIVGTDGDGQSIYERTTTGLYYTKSYEEIGLQNTGDWGTSAQFSGSISYASAVSQSFTVGYNADPVTLSYQRTAGTTTTITANAGDTVGGAGASDLKWETVGFVEHRKYFTRTVTERRVGASGEWTPIGAGTDAPVANGEGEMLGEFKYRRRYWIWLDAEQTNI